MEGGERERERRDVVEVLPFVVYFHCHHRIQIFIKFG